MSAKQRYDQRRKVGAALEVERRCEGCGLDLSEYPPACRHCSDECKERIDGYRKQSNQVDRVLHGWRVVECEGNHVVSQPLKLVDLLRVATNQRTLIERGATGATLKLRHLDGTREIITIMEGFAA